MSESKKIIALAVGIVAIIALLVFMPFKHSGQPVLGGLVHTLQEDFTAGIRVNGVQVISNTGAFTGTVSSGALAATTGTFSSTLAVTGATTFASSAKSTSPSGGIGYATGAGCAVTQATNRTTGVTCTGVSGAITTNNASLAAEAAAEFTVTDTSVAVGDTVIVSQRSGANGGNTAVYTSTVAAGSFKITVANNNAAAGTAETGAIIINFAVIKAVSA